VGELFGPGTTTSAIVGYIRSTVDARRGKAVPAGGKR
jgi:hypothetical protein